MRTSAIFAACVVAGFASLTVCANISEAVSNKRVMSDAEAIGRCFAGNTIGGVTTLNNISTKPVDEDRIITHASFAKLVEKVNALEVRVKALEKEKLLKEWNDDDRSLIFFYSPTGGKLE